jgi:hypothetical protein
MLNKVLNKNITLIVFFIFLISFSIFRSLYVAVHFTDPHHSSLVFYDAYQLSKGYYLFKDIIVIYGILTTLIHYFFLKIFGTFVLSLSIGTALIYSSTFLIFFFILKNLSFTRKHTLIIISIIFLIHPGIVLPWADYNSYFFLLLGFLLFTLPSSNFFSNYFFGVCLGLATLSRQTVFLPILFFLLSTFFFNNLKKNRIKIIFGVLTVFFIFFLYLLFNNLIDLWFIQSFKTWTIFTYKNYHQSIDETLGFFNYFILIKDLLIKLGSSFFNFELKWGFYCLLLVFNIFFLVDVIFFKKKFQQEYKLILISLISIMLFSQSIHINSIFRLSTGSIIGIIPLSVYLVDLSKKISLSFKKIIFFIFFIILIFFARSEFIRSYENYKVVINFNKKLLEPMISILKYQRFPVQVVYFYEKFNSEIHRIHSLYEINYSFNFSDNPLLPIISKTKNTQISSYYNLSGLSKSSDFVNLYKYYPDLNPQEILKKNPNNIILFVMVKNKKEVVNFKEKKIFENFFIFSELNYPLNETNSILLILLPKDIITKIN